ncbi:dethiobiotin synthase [Membranihabitans marinus]|uniref:dethiobiotin synthase n=1 Tax=Membranihabitans marinus TaxID=1227546 RepID=UPI001F337F63|nr:dethiobiotin synthase [Membranihabitans marinus]
MKGFYVAATNQHVGKTTSTLGLAAIFRSMDYNVGYCKPVGQQYLDLDNLRVDKDTLLFADLLGFNLEPHLHSPVILGNGATSAYLDNPSDFHFKEDVIQAANYLSKEHEIVIYEGTGHTGVGSVVNLSNADVAKLLDLGVIMIVEGGIGRTIDRLNMSVAMFREQNVPIIGVIINKVIPEKMDKIKHYVGIKLKEMGLPLLGCIPYDKTMAFPIIKSLLNSINGFVTANDHMVYNKVEDIISGSIVEMNNLSGLKNQLLVTAADKIDEVVEKFILWSSVNPNHSCPLSGVIATGKGDLSMTTERYIMENEIPFIRTDLDTLGTVLKISKIEVKINLKTPWKINRAIELIKENIDLELLKESLQK